jgi:hypothetical protein
LIHYTWGFVILETTRNRHRKSRTNLPLSSLNPALNAGSHSLSLSLFLFFLPLVSLCPSLSSLFSIRTQLPHLSLVTIMATPTLPRLSLSALADPRVHPSPHSPAPLSSHLRGSTLPRLGRQPGLVPSFLSLPATVRLLAPL